MRILLPQDKHQQDQRGIHRIKIQRLRQIRKQIGREEASFPNNNGKIKIMSLPPTLPQLQTNKVGGFMTQIGSRT